MARLDITKVGIETETNFTQIRHLSRRTLPPQIPITMLGQKEMHSAAKVTRTVVAHTLSPKTGAGLT
jgi:hypothetical protein